MDEKQLDALIQAGFERAAGDRPPLDRWMTIAKALQETGPGAPRYAPEAPFLSHETAPQLPAPVRRARQIPRWVIVAASLVAVALLSSLLFPSVLTAAGWQLRSLFRVLWEGEVDGRPAAVVTVPEAPQPKGVPQSPEVRGELGESRPQPPLPQQERMALESLQEAEALLQSRLPNLAKEQVREIDLTSIRLGPGLAMRTVTIHYLWQGEVLVLSAVGSYVTVGDGALELVPIPDLTVLRLRGEQMGSPEPLTLGEIEGLLMMRNFNSGVNMAHFQWVKEGLEYHVTSQNRDLLLRFVPTLTWEGP